eukprot:SAG22_NODE_119_length_19257_cov_43.260413_4_plen_127_part_00
MAGTKEGMNSAVWTFDGDDEDADDQRKLYETGTAFIDIGKRDRKTTNYSENAVFNDLLGESRPNAGGSRKGITFFDFQFIDEARLRPLLEKEKGIVQKTNEATGEVEIESVEKAKLTAKEARLKAR